MTPKPPQPPKIPRRRGTIAATLALAALLLVVLLSAAGAIASEQAAERRAESPKTLPPKTLLVLALGNLKGRLLTADWPQRYPGGLTALAAQIAELRSRYPHTIVLDAGDSIAGLGFPNEDTSPALALPSELPPNLLLLNALQIDAAVPGNRELAAGPRVLERWRQAVSFPWLAANLIPKRTLEPTSQSTGKFAPPPWPSHHIVRRDDVQIGVIGLTTPGINAWIESERRAFQAQDVLVATRRQAAQLRPRVDVLIALVHGDEDALFHRTQALLTQNPAFHAAGLLADTSLGLDLVVAAGWRTSRRFRRDYPTPLLRSGRYGEWLVGATIELIPLPSTTSAVPRWRVAAIEHHRWKARDPWKAGSGPTLPPAVLESLRTRERFLAEASAFRLRRIPHAPTFQRCAGMLAHLALRQKVTGKTEGKAEGEPEFFSLPGARWRFDRAFFPAVGEPIQRRHLGWWLPNQDLPREMHLQRRQVRRLLRPQLQGRQASTSPNRLLYPGGFQLRKPTREQDAHPPEDARQATRKRQLRTAEGDELPRKLTVWLSGFHLGSLDGAQALLHPQQSGRSLQTSWRELIFRYLQNPNASLPGYCRHYLEVISPR